MLRLLVFCLTTLIGATWGYVAQSQDVSDAYRLTTGDKISLRVVIWDEEERAYVIWPAVSGEYSIQTEGRITLPLAGRVQAAGHTPEELADEIATALEKQVRSNDRPSTTVEVAEYSPFFIMGAVNDPGAYPTRPGLTVLQAFALAGGGRRLEEAGVDTFAILRETGTLDQVQAELLRAQITSIRLKAEVEEHTSLHFPDSLVRPDGTGTPTNLLEEERRIFTSRKTALEREQASLTELITLLSTEIESLEKKMESQQEQLDLAEEYLQNTQSLVDKGLARTPQLTQAQRSLFEIEAKTLDLQNSFYRAQQSIKEAERDVLALKANRATQAAVELQIVNARIETLRSRRDTMRRLLLERGAEIGPAGEDQHYIRTFRLQRGRGEAQQILYGPDTVVVPGDVITVEQTLTGTDEAPPG